MPALQIERLKKTYPNGLTALHGIDLTVRRGDFFALLGPNGAGKSTTIGIICGLVRKTSGTVRIFDHDTDRQPALAKASIGVVPQEFNFSQFETCLEILVNQGGYNGIRREAALRRARQYLTRLGLWEKRHEKSLDLSGGLKRRLMIARALIHEPGMLILDEPTAGVDVELRRSMWDFLSEINRRGTTILLTTHYLEEAERLCKKIAIIDNGEIIENTSMKKLLATLSQQTFVLDLASPLNGAMPELNGFSCRRIDGATLEVEITRQQNINALFSELSAHNIHVASMRNKSNRLEELFLGLTGNGPN